MAKACVWRLTAAALAAVWLCLVTNVAAAFEGAGQPSGGRERFVRIGVLAFRRPDQTLARWAPTARYLSEAIAGHRFEMIPMNYPELNQAVADQQIDFLLTNTGHYVELEARYGIARIATLVKLIDGQPVRVFGGVLFTRADRRDIRNIHDLAGKRFLAVDKSSLGGFLVAWEQFKLHGMDPFADFELVFNGMPHDEVVFRVLRGEFDAGTVRTGVLEQLAGEGAIDLSAVRIIDPKEHPRFPYLHSTNLYPEWPFSRMPHTDDELVKEVTVALLALNHDHPAARAGGYDRWAPPLDYQPVHELMRFLGTGPYAGVRAFSLTDVLRRYWPAMLLGLASLLLAIGIFLHIVRLNRKLRQAESRLHGVFDSSIPICFIDRERRIIMANAAYQRAFGPDGEEGSPLPVCQEPRHGSAARQNERCVMQRILDGASEVTYEFSHRTATGERRYFLVAARPLRDDRGKLAGIVECFQDITDRKMSEMERDKLLAELQEALAKVKTLSGFLPICASCKKIRDDQGYWRQIEEYIRKHSEAEFSHSICPDCAKKLYPELDLYKE